MTQYFEYKDEKSAKFWEISINQTSITTRYGKIGTNGKESVKDFGTDEKANKELNKLIAEKTKKGYTLQSTSNAVPEVKQSAKEDVTKEIDTSKSASFELMSGKDFYEKYADFKFNSDFRDVFNEDNSSKSGVLVAEGDVYVKEHLYLAANDLEYFNNIFTITNLSDFEDDILQFTPKAIVIFGNVYLGGSLLNKDEYIPHFYATGNLTAKNLTAGNTFIVIEGSAIISEVIHGYYNDGLLQVNGKKSSAGLFYEDDHAMDISPKIKYKSFKKLQKEKIVVSDLDEDEILDVLYEGKYIFTASATVEEKDYKYWTRQIKKSAKSINRVPADMVDEEMCLYFVECHPNDFKLVPKQFVNESFLLKVIDRKPYAICRFPSDLFNPTIAESVVEKAGEYLGCVPFNLLNKEMCKRAIKSGAGIRSIPSCYLDEDMLCEIIETNSYTQKIPQQYYNLRVLATVAIRGSLPDVYDHYFRYYDEKLGIGIESIALEAIKRGVSALEKLPAYMVSEKVYQIAEALYAQGETATKWDELKTKHSKFIDVDDESDAKGFIHKTWRAFWTKEGIDKILNTIYIGNEQSDIIKYIPAEFISPEVTEKLVICSYHNFKYLPDCLKTEELCTRVLVKSPYSLYEVPESLLTEDLCNLIVSKTETKYGTSKGSGFSLKDVPYEFRTERICRSAIETDKRAIPQIPLKYSYLIDENQKS